MELPSRPKIIHINHLETLAELCTILKIEMLEDHVQQNNEELKAFEAICRQMLEDVQERLVYRTNIYIKDDVYGYVPTHGDIMYPEKLEMMQKIQQEQAAKMAGNSDNDSTASELNLIQTQSTSAADIHGMWYPTVRRVLVCLSKLYRCIEKQIFTGLSQEALANCVVSLNMASMKITEHSTQTDATLFLIKHLLILREQIAPFQADFSVKETSLDFARTKSAAIRFGQKFFNKNGQESTQYNLPLITNRSSGNQVMDFLLSASPEVKEYLIDSKKEVDRNLKINCEKFISNTTNNYMLPIKRFIIKANAFNTASSVIVPGSKNVKEPEKDPLVESFNATLNPQSSSNSNSSGANLPTGGTNSSNRKLCDQEFAKSEVIHKIVNECYKRIKQNTPKVFDSLSLYLAQPEVEQILFKPVRLEVLQIFQQLKSIVIENYNEEDVAIIAIPSPEQVSLMLSK